MGNFVFPVDFVIMDMEENTQVLLLLRRPFLATAATLIDAKNGELTLIVGEEAVHFNLNISLNQFEFESTDRKTVETIFPTSSELILGCNF